MRALQRETSLVTEAVVERGIQVGRTVTERADTTDAISTFTMDRL